MKNDLRTELSHVNRWLSSLALCASLLGLAQIAGTYQLFNGQDYLALADRVEDHTPPGSVPPPTGLDEPSIARTLSEMTVTPVINCEPNGDGTYAFTADVFVSIEDAPTDEDLIVTFNGNEVGRMGPVTAGTATFTGLDLAGETPSFNNVLNVAFATTEECSRTLTLNLIACTPACSGAADEVGGNVFLDADNNGADAGAEEVGQGNVLVTVYDCNDMVVCEVFTNADGDWSCPGAGAGDTVRVEYTTELTPFLQESFAGPDNGTSTQFVIGGECTANYGLFDPATFCLESDPVMATPCYLSGDPLAGGSAGSEPVFISFDYSSSGNGGGAPFGTPVQADEPNVVATGADVGSVFGVAYDPVNKVAYTSAFVKRHVGMGPLGEGGIYRMDFSDPDNPTVAPWIDVNTLGISTGTVGTGATPAARNQDRGLSPETGDLSTYGDTLAFGAVAKIGLADIEVDSEGEFLWVMSPNDKSLNSIVIDADNDPTTPPVAADVSSFTVPDPCGNNTSWPFATKLYRDDVYVGVVCEDALEAYIYRFDGVDFNPVFIDGLQAIDLSYEKGIASSDNSPCRDKTGWFVWRDVPTPRCGNTDLYVHPTPILSDIEFDVDGSMILAFLDRSAHQFGAQSADYFEPTTLENYHGGGDVLRVCNVNGNFVLQGGAGCENNAPNNGFDIGGPNGGEYYFQDYFSFNPGSAVLHGETSVGGLAILPGSGEVAVTSYDPFGTSFLSGGINWFNNTTGVARDPGYLVYFGQDAGGFGGGTGFQSKAAGVGDTEVFCSPGPIQIGNYVWVDADEDGIQDPCELPLAGITVKLFSKPSSTAPAAVPQLLATTTTDATGNYYFAGRGIDDATWEAGVEDDTLAGSAQYFIAFCGEDGFDPDNNFLMLAGSTYCPSLAEVGQSPNDDQNDSDITVLDVGGELLPAYCTQPGELNAGTNHTFDAGFKEICPFVELVPAQPAICGEDSVALVALVDSIREPELFDYVWSTSGDGVFVDAAGVTLTEPVSYDDAVTYLPGPDDRTSGGAVLTLGSTPASTPESCEVVTSTTTVPIQNVDCGSFFWEGSN